MISKFLELDADRQSCIVNAAMTEFAKKGYDDASTNEIVKAAGISKGLLFHYFHSKQELFLFLYELAVNTLLDNLWSRVDLGETDILLRWRQVAVLKIELTANYPELFNFMVAVNFGGANEFMGDLQLTNKQHIASFYQKFFANVNYSMFRSDIDSEQAIEVISWIIEGFSKKLAEKVKVLPLDQIDYPGLLREMDHYLGLVRKVFYSQSSGDDNPQKEENRQCFR